MRSHSAIVELLPARAIWMVTSYLFNCVPHRLVAVILTDNSAFLSADSAAIGNNRKEGSS